jgi:hypothetical protein
VLDDAAANSEPRATIRLRGEGRATDVRLTIKLNGGPLKSSWLRRRLAALGGDAGTTGDGEDVELWLTLPRA